MTGNIKAQQTMNKELDNAKLVQSKRGVFRNYKDDCSHCDVKLFLLSPEMSMSATTKCFEKGRDGLNQKSSNAPLSYSSKLSIKG